MAKKTPDGPLTPDVIPPPKLPGNGPADRQRAYRIAKAVNEGASVPPEDLEYLAAYEKAKQARGASRSKKVTFTSEEMEAQGTGDAAMAAALAAPQLAREEGRRIDSLIRESTNASSAMAKVALAACEMVMKFGGMVLERNGKLEANNIGMLDTFRKSHVEMTHAHAALIQQQAEHEADEITREAEDAAKENEGSGDFVDGIVQQFLPAIVAEMGKRAAAAKGGEG
jgi:hypothetical protein